MTIFTIYREAWQDSDSRGEIKVRVTTPDGVSSNMNALDVKDAYELIDILNPIGETKIEDNTHKENNMSNFHSFPQGDVNPSWGSNSATRAAEKLCELMLSSEAPGSWTITRQDNVVELVATTAGTPAHTDFARFLVEDDGSTSIFLFDGGDWFHHENPTSDSDTMEFMGSFLESGRQARIANRS